MRKSITVLLLLIGPWSASAWARDAAEKTSECRGLTTREPMSRRFLPSTRAESLRLLREYADKRAVKPENVPELVPYADAAFREDGMLLGLHGVQGTLLNSPSSVASVADGKPRSFVLNPLEGYLRVARDNETGQHQNIANFHDVTVPGELTLDRTPDRDGFSLSLSPRSGCYFRHENVTINSYALLGRALQAFWDIGVYPVEVIIMDHETRKPVFRLDLSAAQTSD